MQRGTTIRRNNKRRGVLRDNSGQSLVEIAVMIPIFSLLLCYAVDFGYFFLAAANIESSARNAAQYSILGYQGPAQSQLPNAGPTTDTTSVASLASAELASLVNSATATSIRVCSKSLGMSTSNTQIPNCANYGVTGTAYVPIADPEAPRFVLQRVDVTYTVQPPIPISFFGTSFLPPMAFHREVSMRAMD
jgi:Flp pilus assembly protein TadG